jgi:hypothetical protein
MNLELLIRNIVHQIQVLIIIHSCVFIWRYRQKINHDKLTVTEFVVIGGDDIISTERYVSEFEQRLIISYKICIVDLLPGLAVRPAAYFVSA